MTFGGDGDCPTRGGWWAATRAHLALGVVVAILVTAAGCTVWVPAERSIAPPFIDTGDLSRIRERGVLRVLVPLQRNDRSLLLRSEHPLDAERRLIEMFARQHGLEPRWIEVDAGADLLPALLEGRGDLVAANLTVTPERKRLVEFTVPVASVREQVVARAADRIRALDDLAGRRFAVRRSSSFFATLEQLRRERPELEIEIETVAETVNTEELIRRVARGRLDVTVADSNLVEGLLRQRTDVRAVLDLTGERRVAWAVRPQATELRAELDRFLSHYQMTTRQADRRLDDLGAIRERGVLRVLTRNAPSTYFLYNGKLMGFEYELATRFARRHGLSVEVIVPPSSDQLLPWLIEGRGDVVAAGLTPSAEWRRLGVAWSQPYNHVSQVVVQRKGETGLDGPADLAGRNISARRDGPYWSALSHLRGGGSSFELSAVSERLDIEQMIAGVAAGELDLTVADSHVLDLELSWRDDVDAAFPLGDPVPLAWAVRARNRRLRAALDTFLREEYRGLFYNVIYSKYFREGGPSAAPAEQAIERSGRLSPYDESVRRYCERYELDWPLVVSMMYQESHFDPAARSVAGAVGLLQVMPETGRLFGFENVEEPEANLHAGIRYLDWIRAHFDDELPVRDRMWFTLAAYNVGYGHVEDARELAARLGWDRDRWFGHVERAMLLLGRTPYASSARHGFCRGSEPVRFVREIRDRYYAYLDVLAPTGPLAEAAPMGALPPAALVALPAR